MHKWHSHLPTNFRYEPNDKMAYSESERQRKMLVMVRRLFPDYGVRATHVPNGGKRDKVAGARLKADGVKAGWPDLLFTGPDKFCLFVEVKDGTGVCSKGHTDKTGKFIDGQQEILCGLALDGHYCGVFRTDRALHDFMLDMGAKLRVKYPHDFMEV